MFEPNEPLQQWQKWANLARLEAIRADEAERERDELRARVNELSVHLEMCADVDAAHCIEIVEQCEQIIALLKALKAAPEPCAAPPAYMVRRYIDWHKGQRQAAIAAVEGE